MVDRMRLEIGAGKEIDIKEPKRRDFADNLGGAIEYSLAHFIFKLLDIMGEGLAHFAGGFLIRFLEIIEPELVDYLSPILDSLLSYPELPDPMREFLKALRYPKGQAASALLGSIGQSAGSAISGSVLSSLLAPMTYAVNRQIHPARPGPGDATAMLYREEISPEEFVAWLSDQGYPAELISAYREIGRPRLDLGSLVAAWRRGIIDPGEFIREMASRGYHREDREAIEKLSEIIPGVGDLIRMAVREAFSPEIIERFQLDKDYPDTITEWAKKQGLSREWALKYWISHWELPSLSMGFQMLHRRVIDSNTMEMLIRAHDVSPFWRDKLIKISYAPYTRVDIRRMYDFHILDREDLVGAYMDAGYDKEHAENLAAWTIAQREDDSRELTKADILTAVRDGRLRDEEGFEYLSSIGYDEDQAALLIAREAFRRQDDYEKAIIKGLKAAYISSLIDENEVFAELGKLNLESYQMENYLKIWSIQRKRKIKRLSFPQIRDLIKYEIIDIPTARKELAAIGYSEKYIEWIIALWLAKMRGEEESEG